MDRIGRVALSGARSPTARR